jgi:CO/xanthine dehydrogenase FAD-binding subunit
MNNFLGKRRLPEMIYHRPSGIAEALDMLNGLEGVVRPVAGCTDFIPGLRRGALSFKDGLHIVDLRRVEDLNRIDISNGRVRIGAAVTLSRILTSGLIRQHVPVLWEAIEDLASWQIRNTGTLGGNLCTASPAADTAPPLLVMDAQVVLRTKSDSRKLPLTEFFLGPGKTILKEREILAEIQLQAQSDQHRSKRIKLGRRSLFTLSIVSVAVLTSIMENQFKIVRIALGSVAPTPLRAWKAEKYLTGRVADRGTIEHAAELAAKETKPIDDVRASSAYRQDMAKVLTRRALEFCCP